MQVRATAVEPSVVGLRLVDEDLVAVGRGERSVVAVVAAEGEEDVATSEARGLAGGAAEAHRVRQVRGGESGVELSDVVECGGVDVRGVGDVVGGEPAELEAVRGVEDEPRGARVAHHSGRVAVLVRVLAAVAEAEVVAKLVRAHHLKRGPDVAVADAVPDGGVRVLAVDVGDASHAVTLIGVPAPAELFRHDVLDVPVVAQLHLWELLRQLGVGDAAFRPVRARVRDHVLAHSHRHDLPRRSRVRPGGLAIRRRLVDARDRACHTALVLIGVDAVQAALLIARGLVVVVLHPDDENSAHIVGS
mmetsp:Transcript_8852/g.19256  ORF Transcript_8852/g.19256 Transcript_8852/m.19256 type:complete len:304 (-) Transcript_8852:713-1624(-)